MFDSLANQHAIKWITMKGWEFCQVRNTIFIQGQALIKASSAFKLLDEGIGQRSVEIVWNGKFTRA